MKVNLQFDDNHSTLNWNSKSPSFGLKVVTHSTLLTLPCSSWLRSVKKCTPCWQWRFHSIVELTFTVALGPDEIWLSSSKCQSIHKAKPEEYSTIDYVFLEIEISSEPLTFPPCVQPSMSKISETERSFSGIFTLRSKVINLFG